MIFRNALALVGLYVTCHKAYVLFVEHVQPAVARFVTDTIDDETRRVG